MQGGDLVGKKHTMSGKKAKRQDPSSTAQFDQLSPESKNARLSQSKAKTRDAKAIGF
jgi:hypothetical protein